MKTALTIFQIVARTAWTLVLILGLIFWGGLAPDLIIVHMALGIVLSLLLLGLAILGVRTRVPTGMVVLIIAWSLVLPTLGMTQAQIFPDWSGHWIIKIVHLLVGIGALVQAEMLGGQIKTNLEEASRTHKRPTRKVRVDS